MPVEVRSRYAIERTRTSEERRHDRVLRTESAAAYVIRGWLTGEEYLDPPVRPRPTKPKGKLARPMTRRFSG